MMVLDGYIPQGASADEWEVVRPALAAILAPLDDRLARKARYPLASLALFAHKAGHPVTPELLLEESLLAPWVDKQPGRRSAATHRSTLRRVAAVHRPHLAAARHPIPRNRTVPGRTAPTRSTGCSRTPTCWQPNRNA